MDQFNRRNTPRADYSGRIRMGIILFIAGLLLLAYKMGLPLPSWLFSWPMILIVIGLSIGMNDRFQNPGSWIMLLIGIVFLADYNIIGFDLRRFLIPIVLLVIGAVFIFRPKGGCRSKNAMLAENVEPEDGDHHSVLAKAETGASGAPEYIEATAFLGGVKKLIISKDFRGGHVTTFMGGAELNLMQADIRQPAILEVNNIFGGSKLLIPSNWDLKNEVVAIFGGVEDKRNINSLSPEPDKVLIIRGTCLFGGIEFASY